MAKLRGVGMAAINYPTGMNLGGDPSEALIYAQTGGHFVVEVAAVELGQGLATVMAQIAAESIGVKVEDVTVKFGDTGSAPFDTGTFASRVTHRMGNAVGMAGKEMREAILKVAAGHLEANVDDLEIKDGNIYVKGVPGKSISVADVVGLAHFVYQVPLVGKGYYVKPKSVVNPETGECDPESAYGHGCIVAEVEVDTETGQVEVKKLSIVYEAGRIVNPRLAEGQAIGGAIMGLGGCLTETVYPYYPSVEYQAKNFSDYPLLRASDLPEITVKIVESPTTTNVYGIKGIGEMVVTGIAPAVLNAIYNATGVQITEIPVKPEKVLKALEAKKKK
ncbi:MAG: molybdopterin-dependent oxidoreductase [Aigarchaeota archaeon]|nr:molybdopterin-dependent oxidoreductase [Aigarchaeota archaeon]MDW8092536.1 xanthine dehydrogenase family protein molybdopterin-binding subunit [Nitrososphaerota archaeon]